LGIVCIALICAADRTIRSGAQDNPIWHGLAVSARASAGVAGNVSVRRRSDVGRAKEHAPHSTGADALNARHVSKIWSS
jgi:hypothetical protein